MPKNVVLYERFMLIAIIAGVISSTSERGADMTARHGLVVTVLANLLVVSVFGFMVWLISRRRKNWARWLMVVLLALSVLPWILDVIDDYRTAPATSVLKAMALLAQIIAYYFVFTGDARDWFKKTLATHAPN